MKEKRHRKILELIKNEDIETQEELADCLIKAGYQVTQATVSRDIRELKLMKVLTGENHQKYVSIQTDPGIIDERNKRVLRDGYQSMEMAQNILVIKTGIGMAMAVAAVIDAMEWDEVIGSIAGDDTIMCAIKNVEETYQVMEKIKRVILEKME